MAAQRPPGFRSSRRSVVQRRWQPGKPAGTPHDGTVCERLSDQMARQRLTISKPTCWRRAMPQRTPAAVRSTSKTRSTSSFRQEPITKSSDVIPPRARRKAVSRGGSLPELLADPDKLKAWAPEDSATRAVQPLVFHRRSVVDERTGLTNRLQALLKPQTILPAGGLISRSRRATHISSSSARAARMFPNPDRYCFVGSRGHGSCKSR